MAMAIFEDLLTSLKPNLLELVERYKTFRAETGSDT